MRLRSRHQWGVRKRSVLAAVVTTSIALLVGGVLILYLLQRGVLSNAGVTARSLAHDLAAAYSSSSIESGSLPATSVSYRGSSVQVLTDDMRVVSASDAELVSAPLIHSSPPDGTTAVTHTTTLHSLGDTDEVITAARTFTASGVHYTLVVATPVGVQLATVQVVGLYLLGGVPLLAVLVGWGTSVVVGRALEPVTRIRSQVDRITRARLSERVNVPPTGDEIASLASTMNSMLDRLDAADRLLRQFVADASHELRSPIASVAAAIEVLNDEGAAALPEIGPMIDSENRRMGELVENLLTLARADDEGLLLSPALCDLDDLLMQEVAIARAKSQIEVLVDADPVQARCDPARIRQVLRNLLDNAARFADLRIRVRCRQEGELAVIEVINDGPPIEEADRARVFQRFVRLDASRSRAGGSAGLGLAIIKEICLAHGGAVSTGETNDGECVFRVEIPIQLKAQTRARSVGREDKE